MIMRTFIISLNLIMRAFIIVQNTIIRTFIIVRNLIMRIFIITAFREYTQHIFYFSSFLLKKTVAPNPPVRQFYQIPLFFTDQIRNTVPHSGKRYPPPCLPALPYLPDIPRSRPIRRSVRTGSSGNIRVWYRTKSSWNPSASR